MDSFKQINKNIEVENGATYFENARKAHLGLYFCINEINYQLELQEQKELIEILSTLFNCFGYLYETSNKFYDKVFLKIAKETDERNSRYVNILTPFNNLTEVLTSEAEIRRAKEIVIAQKKDDAVKKFIQEAAREQEFFLADDQLKKDFEQKEKARIEERVQECMDSLDRGNQDYFRYVFEPKVIIATTKRIFDRIASENEQSALEIKNLISGIRENGIIEPSAIEDIEYIKHNVSSLFVEPIKIDTISADFLSKGFMSRTLTEIEDGILESFTKNNRHIAKLAILRYKQLSSKDSRAKESQTEPDKTIERMQHQLEVAQVSSAQLEKKRASKHKTEKKKLEDQIERLKKELDTQSIKLDEARSNLIDLKGGLREKEIALESEVQSKKKNLEENKGLILHLESAQETATLQNKKLYHIQRLANKIKGELSKIDPEIKEKDESDDSDSDASEPELQTIAFQTSIHNNVRLTDYVTRISEAASEMVGGYFGISRESMELEDSTQPLIERIPFEKKVEIQYEDAKREVRKFVKMWRKGIQVGGQQQAQGEDAAINTQDIEDGGEMTEDEVVLFEFQKRANESQIQKEPPSRKVSESAVKFPQKKKKKIQKENLKRGTTIKKKQNSNSKIPPLKKDTIVERSPKSRNQLNTDSSGNYDARNSLSKIQKESRLSANISENISKGNKVHIRNSSLKKKPTKEERRKELATHSMSYVKDSFHSEGERQPNISYNNDEQNISIFNDRIGYHEHIESGQPQKRIVPKDMLNEQIIKDSDNLAKGEQQTQKIISTGIKVTPSSDHDLQPETIEYYSDEIYRAKKVDIKDFGNTRINKQESIKMVDESIQQYEQLEEKNDQSLALAEVDVDKESVIKVNKPRESEKVDRLQIADRPSYVKEILESQERNMFESIKSIIKESTLKEKTKNRLIRLMEFIFLSNEEQKLQEYEKEIDLEKKALHKRLTAPFVNQTTAETFTRHNYSNSTHNNTSMVSAGVLPTILRPSKNMKHSSSTIEKKQQETILRTEEVKKKLNKSKLEEYFNKRPMRNDALEKKKIDNEADESVDTIKSFGDILNTYADIHKHKKTDTLLSKISNVKNEHALSGSFAGKSGNVFRRKKEGIREHNTIQSQVEEGLHDTVRKNEMNGSFGDVKKRPSNRKSRLQDISQDLDPSRTENPQNLHSTPQNNYNPFGASPYKQKMRLSVKKKLGKVKEATRQAIDHLLEISSSSSSHSKPPLNLSSRIKYIANTLNKSGIRDDFEVHQNKTTEICNNIFPRSRNNSFSFKKVIGSYEEDRDKRLKRDLKAYDNLSRMLKSGSFSKKGIDGMFTKTKNKKKDNLRFIVPDEITMEYPKLQSLSQDQRNNLAQRIVEAFASHNSAQKQQYNSVSDPHSKKAIKTFEEIVKRELEGYISKHKGRCSDFCPHLQRFYQRITILLEEALKKKYYELKKIYVDEEVKL